MADTIFTRLQMVGQRAYSQDASEAARSTDEIGDATLRSRESALKHKKATDDLAAAIRKYGRDSDQAARAQIRLERAQIETERSQRRLQAATEAATSANEDSSPEILRLARNYDFLGRTMKLIKPAATIAALGLFAQGAAAAGAGVVALSAAAAPAAAGGLAAYPSVALAGAQGLGVFKLATMGVTDAVGGLNDSLDRSSTEWRALTPDAQRFASQLDAMKGPLRELQRVAQAGMLPGFGRGLAAASRNLPVLRPIVAGTGGALGAIAANAGQMAGSRAWGADLAKQGARNVRWLELGGTATLRLADASRNLIVTAGPLVDWMVRGGGALAEMIDNEVRAGRETGRLAAFFESAREPMRSIWRIATGVGGALWNIGKGGRALGDDLLRSLGDNAQQFERWTGSARGRNEIAEYFRDARAPLYATGRLLRDSAVLFARLGDNPSLAPMIDQLRTGLLPVLSRVVESTTEAFGPEVIDLIVAMANAFEPLAGASGPLVLFVDMLTGLANASAWIADTVPGGAAAMTLLFGAFAVLQTLGLMGFVSGLLGAGKGVRVLTAAIRLLLPAIRATSAAMLANPAVLFAAGVLAVGVAFFVAYRKVRWFRNGVDATWSWIKDHWPLLFGIITGPIGLAVSPIVDNLGRIKGAFSSVFGGLGRIVADGFAGMKGVVISILEWIADRIDDAGSALNSLPSIDLPGADPIDLSVPKVPRPWNGAPPKGPSGARRGGTPSPALTTPGYFNPFRPGPLAAAGSTRTRRLDLTMNTNLDGRLVGRNTLRHIDDDESWGR